MSCTNSPNTTQIGCAQLADGNTNGVYPSVQASVKDRFLWDEKRFTAPFEARKSDTYRDVVCDRYFPNGASGYCSGVSGVDVNPIWAVLTVFGFFLPLEVFFIVRVIK